MTLHIVLAPTMDAGLAYCRAHDLPAGRYDRSRPGHTVEIVTPASTGTRLRDRRMPVRVHDALGDGVVLPEQLRRQVDQLAEELAA